MSGSAGTYETDERRYNQECVLCLIAPCGTGDEKHSFGSGTYVVTANTFSGSAADRKKNLLRILHVDCWQRSSHNSQTDST